ncbi:MAG TPA: hypothetical protein VMT91_13095 [Anaerolineales bacterium]|nr:hypothetical protein [Anaerolineales bacterium]
MDKGLSLRLLSVLIISLIGSFLSMLLFASCSQQKDQFVALDPPIVKTATFTKTLLASSTPTLHPTPTSRKAVVPWADALQKAADSFIRDNPQDALKLVQSLGYVQVPPGGLPEESPDNACGPLSVAILNTAGIFYPRQTPVVLNHWWEPNPALGEPWGMLDMSHYKLYQFLTYTADGIIGKELVRKRIPGNPSNAIQKFDFSKFRLCPGDLLYTRSIGSGFDHIVVVSELDQQNRVWAVDNTQAPASDQFIIARVLLYDPSDLMVGELKTNFENHRGGKSGKAGFWLLRPNGGCLTPPGYEQFLVNP